jgi:hypothetical protein
MIEYRDLTNALLLSENWQVANGNLSGTATIGSTVPGLTIKADLKLATN